jgi:hypothetical protein
MVVPEAARAQVLATLHLQHTGVTKTLMDARQLFFLPGMTNAIELMISQCSECTACLPAQALKPQILTEARRPFEKFSVDLGKQKGKNYLIGVDRYSGWPMVVPLPKEDTRAVTDILDDWFIEHGIPVSIWTDGEPQFRGPFKTWCAKHRIKHELSSAYSHELNGHAECAVREMKKLLTKTPSYIAFRNALRGYRNCPRYDGLSPAQWCVGRRQRTSAVAFPAAYDRIPDATIALHEAKRRKKAGKLRSYKIKSSRHWAQLRPGQVVTAQDPLTGRWDQRATVVIVEKMDGHTTLGLTGTPTYGTGGSSALIACCHAK